MKTIDQVQIILPLSLSFLYAQSFNSKMEVIGDGIELDRDIYKSDCLKDDLVVLIGTPYDKSGIGEIVKFFTVNDYIVVVQDVRGKYLSDDNFIPFSNEISDKQETRLDIPFTDFVNDPV
mgnify:CR=1 FL=1